jgi:ABC-type amino acid transport substrate-binding protein
MCSRTASWAIPSQCERRTTPNGSILETESPGPDACKPEIKKPEDLKGKKIGVGRIGGNSHYFVQLALRQKGIDPSRDVSPIQTGGAPETFLALSSGAVDAAALTTPQDTPGSL